MEDSDLPQSPRKRQKLDLAHVEPVHIAMSNSDSHVDESLTSMLSKNESHDGVMAGAAPAIEGGTTLDQSKKAIPASVSVKDDSVAKELQVGIKELVNPSLPGFSGILKKRYTDFLVNEILPSGEVVHLDDLNAPRVPKAPKVPTALKGLGSVTDLEEQALAKTSAAQSQGEQIARSATIEQPQDVELELSTSSSTHALRQEHDQPDQIPQEVSTHLADLTSEVNVAREGANKEAEEVGPQGEHDNGSTEKMSLPVEPNPSKNAFPELNKDLNQWQAFAKDQPGFQLSAENAATLSTYFAPEVISELLTLFNRVVDSPHRETKDYGTVNAGKITDREKRTQIHKDLRRIFSSRLESATDENGFMMVTAAVSTGSMNTRNDRGGKGQGRGQDRGRGRGGRGGYDRSARREQATRINWQELGGDYLHFSIYKENRDTMEVIAHLHRTLHKRPQDFQFAGTKDRRAITVQRASVYHVQASDMVAASRNLRHASIGNFQHQKQGLDLGDLMGNEFVITLRDCQFDGLAETDTQQRLQLARKIVQDAAKHLSDEGFINYYGLQRFGTYATRTDAVGLKMLKGDLKGAVADILAFEPGALAAAKDPMPSDTTFSSDDKARAWAIDNFQRTGKSHPALEELPHKFSAEAAIIRHLGNPHRRNHNDFKGALQFVPRNLRLMYVHAYQSLVWNLAASARWARFGKDVVEGDLVLVNDHKNKEDTNHTVDPLEELDSDGAVIIHPAAYDSSRSEEDRFERARALTAEEAKSGRYTILDVLLPTPGFDVLYPANEIGEFYTTYMKSEAGGGLDPNDMRRAWKEVSLSGNYRKLIARPFKPVQVEVKSYIYEDEQFVETDMEVLKKKEILRKKKQSDDAHIADTDIDRVAVNSKDEGNDDVTDLNIDENTMDARTSLTKPVDDLDQDLQPGLEQTKLTAASKESEEASNIKVDPLEAANDTAFTNVPDDTTMADLEDGQDIPKLAVILKLQLGSSQYATMALRELMKEGGLRIYKPDYGMR